MLGTSAQFARRHRDDRFYDAAKVRRSSAAAAAAAAAKEKIAAVENRAGAGDPPGPSNLDRFLESITPVVPAHYASKTRMRGWKACDAEQRPYFILGNLWESFKEWSAYGAGVPLILNGCDGVVQYYVPYLSGIQLYGLASRQTDSPRRAGEDSDESCCHDSSSDGSSDSELAASELENRSKFPGDWIQSHLSNRMDRLSIREQYGSSQEGFSSDDSESGNSQGCLLFEYLESDSPYCREPLADKISKLASCFPDLKTLRSCDLLPASWVSVAWYPIYRIPTGPTLKDLDACFLTFHFLSTPSRGVANAGPVITYPQGVDGVPKMRLPAFGLATYKFKNAMWSSSVGDDKQLASSLLQTAHDWLQRLRVNHRDYQFFVSHGAFRK
ncbi:uncharacterized protein LOC109717618 [Ananas comosus]|uniref:Uncharacterized protein LOC109717618 n=1 Tax=Ananas comosus TaxID=4615 RepID=A0A6P5FTT1_ANACO|nr:uncharacterized protein LOC109717618 [Ananas comosus]